MFEETFITRSEQIDGIGDWLWIGTDTGGWSGPANEWKEFKIFWLQHVEIRRVCLQAGGNQGLYPRLLSEHFDKVITFEPDPLNFHCLVHNCSKSNIIKMNAALGDEACFCKVNRTSMNNVGMHTVEKATDGTVSMMTVDSLNLDVCDFMQLDVEGYEENILKGAIKTIEKCKPVISMENGDSQSLKNILEPFGYKHIGRKHSDDLWKCS